jgi:MFS family permease
VLTGIAFVARIAAMPALEVSRTASAAGSALTASLGSAPLPALWLVSQHFAWLLLVQVAAGVAWGAFELATLLVFFDDIPERQRTSVLSMFNLANAFAAVIGAGAGSLLFRAFGPQLAGYAVLFVVSSCLRIAGLVWLRRSIGAYTRPIGPV